MVILLSLFIIGIALGFIAGYLLKPNAPIIQEVKSDELNYRTDTHVHDWHIQGKYKGLILYTCSNDICDEIRLLKQVPNG